MKRITIQLCILSRQTGRPAVLDQHAIETDDLDLAFKVVQWRCEKFIDVTVTPSVSACLYHDSRFLGTFDLDTGEFYPSNFFDDNPHYLTA